MKTYMVLWLVCCFGLTGCSSPPKNLSTDDIRIEVQADNKVNFSEYKTYSWLGSAGVVNDPEGKWKQPEFDVNDEIRFLIGRELHKRGMTEANGQSADVGVAYVLGLNMATLNIKEDPETNIKIYKDIPKGTLAIILVDMKKGRPIWNAKLTAQVQQSPNAETSKKRLDFAITEMMNKIPD